MVRFLNNYNAIELLSINLLNIGFISAEVLMQGIPIVVSVLVGVSIIALNAIKFYKEFKSK